LIKYFKENRYRVG